MSEIIGYNDRVILDQYGASIGSGDGSRSSRPTCSAIVLSRSKHADGYDKSKDCDDSSSFAKEGLKNLINNKKGE